MIQNIHEYCVENIIDKQAKEFYSDFKIKEIKPQLIADYKKTEHERRRDHFEGFCLSMFQQVEAVVNYIFESKETLQKIKDNKDKPVYEKWNKDLKKWERSGEDMLIPFLLMKKNKDSKKYTMDNNLLNQYFDDDNMPIVNYNPIKKSWGFLNRLRAILFFYYFEESLKSAREFNEVYNPGKELYTVRNQNHRGSTPSEYQKKTINNIKGNESKYYLIFYGFLVDFVTEVNSNYSNAKEDSNPKNQSGDKKKTQSRFLDDKSLSALKQVKKNIDS